MLARQLANPSSIATIILPHEGFVVEMKRHTGEEKNPDEMQASNSI